MSTPVHLTDRDREVLSALAVKVRLFSQRQLSDHFFHGDLANVRRRMHRLAEAELVTSVSVLARTLPLLEKPLASWQLTDPTPDFGAIAHRCQQRWKGLAARNVTAWMATEQTAQLFGGRRRGQLAHGTQATHDLGVSEVWLRFRSVAPLWATAWQGEDAMAETRTGEKLPDAFIVDQTGVVMRIIEFAGAYDTERVRAVHQDCVSRNLAYQLW